MSSSSSEVSQATTKVGGDSDSSKTPKSIARKSIRRVAQSTNAQDILLFLLAFRLLNALTVRTFFQPDEYFQSLEPAWQLAFGEDSGAWITWEWKNHIRSAIHPTIFSVVYRGLNELAKVLNLSPKICEDLLLAGPKTLQAVFAALGDYYTWKLGEHVYGRASVADWATLVLTIVSPWQWFVSTRTLSNCLETTLTIIALYNWPWHWSLSSEDGQKPQVDEQGLRIRNADDPDQGSVDETTRLRRSLLLAALATILRPTNILVWIVLALMTFVRSYQSHSLVRIPWTEQSALVHYSAWSIALTTRERLVLLRESFFCGSAILCLSAFCDRAFYGAWTFPPFNFLYFNVVQSLAVFYGNNDWHYYISQGYPLLLTTALPFALIGIYKALLPNQISQLTTASELTLQNLAITCLVVPTALSLISHKEVRFIYPLLPPLHVLSAGPLSNFFGPALTHEATHPKLAPPYRLLKRLTIAILLLINLTIALYTTTTHNSGIINVTDYLRDEFTTHYLPNAASPSIHYPLTNMTVAFLMPCHSIPWRSHLQYPPTASTPGIAAWALTCEPPLNLTSAEKVAYLDEADAFYENPAMWLRRNMMRGPPIPSSSKSKSQFRATHVRSETYAKSTKREWPDYLVFFDQLKGVMQGSLRGSGYAECEGGRFRNSKWHDDWRRKGDVVVWCLERGRQLSEKSIEAREAKRREEGPMSWLRGASGMGRDEMSMSVDGVGQRILGGGRGPWGVGGGVKEKTAKAPAAAAGSGLVDRVVEKARWKQRAPEPKVGRLETWWHRIPGLKPRRKKGWWERVRDAGGL